MTATAPSRQAAPEHLFERVEELQGRLDALGEHPARELADELVATVVQMYGAGLERILRRLTDSGAIGRQLAGELADDGFLATLLLIHDLHPVPLEDRVQAALDSVRPYMESHGGNVELLSLDGGVARIHLRGSCSDCSASAVTLELAIKRALEQAAPDLEGLEVEGIEDHAPAGGLPVLTGSGGSGIELPVVTPSGSGWIDLPRGFAVVDGAVTAVTVAGRRLAVASVGGTLLAYRDRCAACGGAVHAGTVSAGTLTCPGCGRAFLLTRAGRSLDEDRLQLEPIPLLRDGTAVRVAL